MFWYIGIRLQRGSDRVEGNRSQDASKVVHKVTPVIITDDDEDNDDDDNDDDDDKIYRKIFLRETFIVFFLINITCIFAKQIFVCKKTYLPIGHSYIKSIQPQIKTLTHLTHTR